MRIAQLQPQLYQTFKQIIASGRLSHAYLFSGDFGSFELAIWLAKSRFCEDKIEGLPCESCRACRLILDKEFSDVKIVEPQGQLIKTDTIRDLTRDFTRSGFEGKDQVFIIRDADKMHGNAANSLLKFIEEPTSQSYIILLTSDESKVLPTIKSRCQIYRLPKQVNYLQELLLKEGLLKSQADILAQIAKDDAAAFELANNSKIIELLAATEHFVKQFLTQTDLVYLDSSRLVSLATDKELQVLVIEMLTVILAKQQKPNLLTKCHQLKNMWQANVSFQNALEYFVILPV